jgi:general secretion pathway protein G
MVLRNRRKNARAAFTLLEILVVVGIIVILAGAATPLLLRHLDQTKIDRAKMDCRVLSDTVSTYKVHYGDYPASLDMLTQPQADGSLPYLEPQSLVDPWNRRYEYSPQGQHNAAMGKPDIWSNGPRPGDPNGIIGNW